MKTYKKVSKVQRDKNGYYPQTREQKIESIKPFNKPIYMIATKTYHKLGDLSREYQEMSSENLCYINKEIDDVYIGSWVTGYGFFNVMFPKETTRNLTEKEIEHFNKMSFQISNQPPLKLNIEENSRK